MALLPLGPMVAAALFFVGEEPIRVVGSDTMLILDRELAAEYSRSAPAVRFEVAGGGSETGIHALMEGRTDVAAASRAMKESECAEFQRRTGRRPEEIVVALDGLAVYVHQGNPVSTLTLAQLARIMTGEFRNWREVGGLDLPIDVITRDQNSGTRGFMQEHVLGKNEPYSPLARVAATTEQMTREVSIGPGSIGYGGIAYAKGARIVKLALRPAESGVFPGQESVCSGAYPLARALYYYVDPGAKRPALRAFLAWVGGAEGRRVIERVGYFGRPAPSGPPASAAANPALVVPRAAPPNEVALTPENATEQGFDLAMVTRESIVPGERRVAVAVRFGKSGRAIERIHRVVLVIGDQAEVPIELAADRTLQFQLRRELVASSSLRLFTGDAAKDGTIYSAALGAFCPVE